MQLHPHLRQGFTAVLLVAGSLNAPATIVTIQVGGATNSFSPSSTTVTLGDTVRWQWVAGFHTTTSTTIPSGAASWNQTMSSAGSFDYVPAVTGTYNYWCVPHSPAMAGTFTVTSPLPVKMDELKAELTADKKVQLRWNTFMEDRNRHFEIQHSADGFTFKTAGIQPSLAEQGSSASPIAYSWLSVEPLVTRAYYRLYQVDQDGRGGYSNVCFVSARGANDMVLHLHPNPFKDHLMIHLEGKPGSQAEIQLLDASGRLLQAEAITGGYQGMTTFDTRKLPAGNYMIRYTDQHQTLVEKVTKKE